MLADLVRLLHPGRGARYERSFVRHVRVESRAPRNRKVERFIAAGWIVILLKSVGVFWLFARYSVPVNPLWVVAPTIVFAALATAVYLLRD